MLAFKKEMHDYCIIYKQCDHSNTNPCAREPEPELELELEPEPQFVILAPAPGGNLISAPAPLLVWIVKEDKSPAHFYTYMIFQRGALLFTNCSILSTFLMKPPPPFL